MPIVLETCPDAAIAILTGVLGEPPAGTGLFDAPAHPAAALLPIGLYRPDREGMEDFSISRLILAGYRFVGFRSDELVIVDLSPSGGGLQFEALRRGASAKLFVEALGLAQADADPGAPNALRVISVPTMAHEALHLAKPDNEDAIWLLSPPEPRRTAIADFERDCIAHFRPIDGF